MNNRTLWIAGMAAAAAGVGVAVYVLSKPSTTATASTTKVDAAGQPLPADFVAPPNYQGAAPIVLTGVYHPPTG